MQTEFKSIQYFYYNFLVLNVPEHFMAPYWPAVLHIVLNNKEGASYNFMLF